MESRGDNLVAGVALFLVGLFFGIILGANCELDVTVRERHPVDSLEPTPQSIDPKVEMALTTAKT